MSEKHPIASTTMNWLRRHWLLASVLGLGLLVAFSGQPAWAANGLLERNQTVPAPTPTTVPVPPTDVPQPPPVNTPAPSSNGDNNDDENGDDNNAAGGGAAGALPAALPAAEPAAAPAADTAPALTVNVNVPTLNVRGTPSTAAPIVGKLTQGATVTVLGRNATGDWYFICCVADTASPGWISAQFVTPNFAAEQAAAVGVVADTAAGAAATAITTTNELSGTVTATSLRVRQNPSTTAEIVGRVTQDRSVSIVGRNQDGTWLAVCCATDTQARGWVSAEFVALNQPGLVIENLPVVDTDALPAAPAPTPTAVTPATPAEEPTPAAAPAETGVTTPTAAAGGDAALAVALVQRSRPLATDGATTVEVRVKNTGGAPAENVTLRNVLPAGLEVVNATAQGGGQVSQEQDSAGQPVVVVSWPAAGAGETLLVRVAVRPVAGQDPPTALNSTAAVEAANAAPASASLLLSGLGKAAPIFW